MGVQCLVSCETPHSKKVLGLIPGLDAHLSVRFPPTLQKSCIWVNWLSGVDCPQSLLAAVCLYMWPCSRSVPCLSRNIAGQRLLWSTAMTMSSIIWILSIFWAAVPLMGWGVYDFEPMKTCCTLDYTVGDR